APRLVVARDLGVQELQRHVALEVLMEGAVDAAETAPPEAFLQDVAPRDDDARRDRAARARARGLAHSLGELLLAEERARELLAEAHRAVRAAARVDLDGHGLRGL